MFEISKIIAKLLCVVHGYPKGYYGKMRTRVVVAGLMACVSLAVVYMRVQNAKFDELTENDHPILRILSLHHSISSTDESFNGFIEVCIVNDLDIVGSDGRFCKTTGEVLALIREKGCEVIPLEKLRTRVLLSENTRECKSTNKPFRIIFHKRADGTEILDFD